MTGNFYSVGRQISLPLFTGGRIRSNIAVQTSRQRQALISYQPVILTALEEVENALVNYSQEQERRDRLSEAVANWRSTLPPTSTGRVSSISCRCWKRKASSTPTKLSWCKARRVSLPISSHFIAP
jgi:outer membrane efflux protein